MKDRSAPISFSGFLSLKHAAEWADVSVRTMKRWIEKGLPKYQFTKGGKVLIRLSDIEQFLQNIEVGHDLSNLVEETFQDLKTR